MNSRQAAVAALQARLGHTFADPGLLERALTHASVGGGAPDRASDYEVLEFIGDRVIGLLAAERLAELHPKAAEGELSVRLHGLVSGQACARVARRLDMGPALRLAGGETKMGDACEAVMAAVYRDGGLEAARAVFLAAWREEFETNEAVKPRDPKTALQEWAQGLGKPLPLYEVTHQSGPAHQPLFTVSVRVEGLTPALAQGATRREAEKAAAANLLRREGQI